MFVHMLDECDLVNAGFVLERVPEPIRKRNELLGHATQVLKALDDLQFHQAI
jgi:hypothetical protein